MYVFVYFSLVCFYICMVMWCDVIIWCAAIYYSLVCYCACSFIILLNIINLYRLRLMNNIINAIRWLYRRIISQHTSLKLLRDMQTIIGICFLTFSSSLMHAYYHIAPSLSHLPVLSYFYRFNWSGKGILFVKLWFTLLQLYIYIYKLYIRQLQYSLVKFTCMLFMTRRASIKIHPQ